MDHCNGTGATTPGAKTFLSDNTGIYSEFWPVFPEMRIDQWELGLLSHLNLSIVSMPSWVPVLFPRELWGGDGKAVPWSLLAPVSHLRPVSRQMSCLSSARGVARVALLAMVQWSPGHMGSFAVASADLCMGHRRGPEIALQPFNKSCPSSEYINFSLCLSQGGVTCHEKPVKDVFSPLGN